MAYDYLPTLTDADLRQAQRGGDVPALPSINPLPVDTGGRALVPADPPPRYDAVFQEGAAWLDTL